MMKFFDIIKLFNISAMFQVIISPDFYINIVDVNGRISLAVKLAAF